MYNKIHLTQLPSTEWDLQLTPPNNGSGVGFLVTIVHGRLYSKICMMHFIKERLHSMVGQDRGVMLFLVHPYIFRLRGRVDRAFAS